MPRIRAEQLQSLTLTDAQISDGRRYAADGTMLQDFDPLRLIDQAKIRDLQYQPNGWISQGIINRVETLPEWQAEYEGRLFYVNTSDELYLGIGTEPWFILISGNTASGWDAELTVRLGTDAMDWNGSIGTRFQTLSYTFSPDGSDLFVYLNGNLQRLDHDYEIIDQRTIRTTRNIQEFDTVTMLVILSNSMLNYATKSWVFEQINSGGINHSLDAAYDDGSTVAVDNRNVDFRLSTDKQFIISQGSGATLLPAVHTGTENFSGYRWDNINQSFEVVYRNGGVTVGPVRALINIPAVNIAEGVTAVNNALVTAGVGELFAFNDGNNIGLQTTAKGSEVSFDIYSGTNALPVFGLNDQTVTGDDAYSSYHEFGLNEAPSNPTGLADNETFWLSVNGVEHSITTGVGTTYSQLRSLLDTELDAVGFTVTTEGNDIRITNDIPGSAEVTNITPVSFAGTIEITQVTASADSDRNLDGKYFTLQSIDSALFGHPKDYYVWYHLDAEAESTEITATAEDSGGSLSGSYFSISSPSTDYYVWYEVETPQSSGYQELGLTGVVAGSSTGLTQNTPYYFKVSVDGGPEQEFNFTTPPDLSPVAEVTEVTTPADVSQSLSGKYWSLNSQSGQGFYVWYNIDTPANQETTEVTAVADVSQSLTGKAFTIFSPGQQYYAWLRTMTDPGLPLQEEITEVTTSADVSQSLSGKYFLLDSASGSDYYVWYEMETDPGVAAQSEITEVTTVDDSSQSLSGTYFEVSSPAEDYYVWYRMQIADPVTGVAEETDVTIPGDSAQSLSGKYWTFNTPFNDYYVWYRMEEQPMQPATSEVTRATFTSNVVADYIGQWFRVYNFDQAYDFWLDTTGTDTQPTGLSNPTRTDISSASTADDIAFAVLTEINGAAIPFSAAGVSAGVIDITCDNAGAGHQAAQGDTSISVAVEVAGTDMTPAVFSTNPAIPGKTGVGVNISEDDANTVVATATYNALNLLSDVTATINSAIVSISNDDAGAVDDAADVDAGVGINLTTQGVNAQGAQYSANPNPAGRLGIQVDISENDLAADIASLTAGVLNALPQFAASSNAAVITVENATAGAVTDAGAGTSGFGINITQQGVDFVAPTLSTDPAVAGRNGIKVQISENESAVNVAEETALAIDANAGFSASRANSVVTITDATQGATAGVVDVDTGFGISVVQDGQDFVAPTYTADPGHTGVGIPVTFNENDSAIQVAQAIENAFNGAAAFTASRVNEVVSITTASAGAATDAVDIDSGFGISVSEQGLEAYSSVDPAVAGKTGLKVNIEEDDTSDTVAVKTQQVVNGSAWFSANVSGSTVTVIDSSAGAVTDAADGDSGVSINVTQQGSDFIAADLSWGNIVSFLNAATSSAASWSITGGDVRLSSDDTGSWTSISIASGSTGTDLFSGISGFSSLDASVPGTSTYSAAPSVTGTPIKVGVVSGAGAVDVAAQTAAAIDGVADFNAAVGTTVGIDDHIVTVDNISTGAVADISDSGTGFVFSVINQGADESADPNVANSTGIRVDIVKNDDAISVASKTQSVLDVGGEFYVSRLDDILSIQNDHPGGVDDTADVNTGFAFLQTGDGQDVKYSLFGANGLDITLPAATAGIDAVPAVVPVGSVDLSAGYNFFTFPKDMAISINGGPVTQVFFDQAVFNSSEMISHINTKIADAGLTNVEAYQTGGYVGFRTTQTGLSESLEIQSSLADALATLGWSAGTYTGDYGTADSILEVNALTGGNEIEVSAAFVPSAHGMYDIGAEGNKFRSLYVQDLFADAGTIYIGDAKISEAANEFAFTVDDGVNQWDHFGNQDSGIAPTGASRIGVSGVTGVIPERAGAQPGDPGTLQEMLAGFAKSAGGGKVFPDMSATTGTYGDPTNLKGFLNEKANGLYLKDGEIVFVESLNREVQVITGGGNTGIQEGVDWKYIDSFKGDSFAVELGALDVNQEPVTGNLAADSIKLSTTGGISLETATGQSVSIDSDTVTMTGDLTGNPTKEINGFGKVYNAVWNDIADLITVENECIVEYGKCYYVTKDGKHRKTTEVAQKGILGLASDTYGYGLGKNDDVNQLPLAVGGIVLAYIDGEVEPGDVLTSGPEGNLVVMSPEDKAAYPERIVAVYYKPEPSEDYNGIQVNGRHWVKVK